jgi:hypothetical protein
MKRQKSNTLLPSPIICQIGLIHEEIVEHNTLTYEDIVVAYYCFNSKNVLSNEKVALINSLEKI